MRLNQNRANADKIAMKALILVVPFLVGCVTYQPTELVTAKYKPQRSGVIKIGNSDSREFDKQSKREASAIMRKFCSPQRAEILEVSKSALATGSTGVGRFSQIDFEEQGFVHFQCVDHESAELDL